MEVGVIILLKNRTWSHKQEQHDKRAQTGLEKLTNLLKVNGTEFELGRLWGRQLSLQLLESGVIFKQNSQQLRFTCFCGEVQISISAFSLSHQQRHGYSVAPDQTHGF